MEELQIRSKLINLEKQLEIVKDAREYLARGTKFGWKIGLCRAIGECLPTRFGRYNGNISFLRHLIPLFTQENAIKYCNGIDTSFWWPRCINGKPNIAPRLKMLDWMEGLIKEEINKNK